MFASLRSLPRCTLNLTRSSPITARCSPTSLPHVTRFVVACQLRVDVWEARSIHRRTFGVLADHHGRVRTLFSSRLLLRWRHAFLWQMSVLEDQNERLRRKIARANSLSKDGSADDSSDHAPGDLSSIHDATNNTTTSIDDVARSTDGGRDSRAVTPPTRQPQQQQQQQRRQPTSGGSAASSAGQRQQSSGGSRADNNSPFDSDLLDSASGPDSSAGSPPDRLVGSRCCFCVLRLLASRSFSDVLCSVPSIVVVVWK